MDYCDTECFALEMNRDRSVIFEIASKYCISDSFVNYEGYSTSSKEFCQGPAPVDPGNSKVGMELVSLEITYLITDRAGLEN